MRHHTTTTPGTASDATPKLSAKINVLERELHSLYLQRAGRMEPGQQSGWCVQCGRRAVFPADGEDTCRACIAELSAEHAGRPR